MNIRSEMLIRSCIAMQVAVLEWEAEDISEQKVSAAMETILKEMIKQVKEIIKWER